jgi:hypothetical protein
MNEFDLNEFDLRLESELRQLLDPISAAPVPARRGRPAPEALKIELWVVTPEKLAAIRVDAY